MSNEITAFFKGRVGVCESVYQYDYGLVMILDGVNFESVFDAYFQTTNEEDATPVIGTNNRVAIPNSCLRRPGQVTLHIPVHTGLNDSEVEYIVTFKVINRARPIYDGTPEESTAIAKAIAALQNIQGDVNAWLDAHPEATTSVQDGSLTEAKFTDALKLKTLKDYVTPQMFGAKADGTTDDTNPVQSAVNSGKPVVFPAGTYKLTDSIVVNDGCNWLLDSKAELLLDSESTLDCFIQVTNEYRTHDYDSVISGGCFNGNYKCNTVLGLHGYRHLKVDHARIENFNAIGVDAMYGRSNHGADCGEGVFDSLLIRNSTYKADSIGIYDGHDNMYNNIIVQDVCTGFNCGSSSFTNCHYWASIEDVFDHSLAFYIRGDSCIENAIIDTCKTGFLLGYIANAMLTNIEFIHNPAVISQAHANSEGIYLFDFEAGANLIVNNLNCLLYSGYTNVHKFTDRVIAYDEKNYTMSFSNDFYLARTLLKNNITRTLSSPIYRLQTYQTKDAATTFTAKLRKFDRTNLAHFIMFGGQSYQNNFFIMGVIDDQNDVAFIDILNPDSITFTGTYDNSDLVITASTTLYGGIRLLWLN